MYLGENPLKPKRMKSRVYRATYGYVNEKTKFGMNCIQQRLKYYFVKSTYFCNAVSYLMTRLLYVRYRIRKFHRCRSLACDGRKFVSVLITGAVAVGHSS